VSEIVDACIEIDLPLPPTIIEKHSKQQSSGDFKILFGGGSLGNELTV